MTEYAVQCIFFHDVRCVMNNDVYHDVPRCVQRSIAGLICCGFMGGRSAGKLEQLMYCRVAYRLETYDKLEKLQVIFYVLSDASKETDVTQIRDSWLLSTAEANY